MLHSQEVQVESALLFETPVEIFARVFRQLRPSTPLPPIQVDFCEFAGANSVVRLNHDGLHARITDALEGAPVPILEALAYILLCKLFRKPAPRTYNHRYRLYMNRRDMTRSLHLMRQARGRKLLSGPHGEHYQLDEAFEDLNFRYFHGLLARPLLSWSRHASRSILGHYDPSHNAIIISKLLDRASVPALALEYVVFHEMLHLRYPVEHKGHRRRVHTREFREAEKSFSNLSKAKEMLRRL